MNLRTQAVWWAGLVVACSGDRPSAGTPEAEAAPKQAPAAKTNRGTRVVVERVEPHTFVDRLDVSATVLTSRDVVLSARVEGTVERMAELGQRVRKGAVVARLDPELARAGLARAEANLQAAKAQLALAQQTHDRQKPLFEREVISALEFEELASRLRQAEAQVAQAEAQSRQAREELARTRIRAPFAGTVEARYVEVGEQVAPGSQVVRLVNTDQVRVRGSVPERYAQDIRTSDEAQVRFSAYGIPPRTGPVRFVGRAIDPATRTFPVEVVLDNADGVLKPEMVARLQLDRATVKGALVVPQNAVLNDERGQSVFVVRRDGEVATVDRRRVRTGARSGGQVVVEDGLARGDEVVIVGQANVNTGDRVVVSSRTNDSAEVAP